MRVGIVGAGQLGLMLGQAGRELDIECCFLDPSAEPPAAACGPVERAAFDDHAALARLAAQCDVLTYEFENVPVDAIQRIAEDIPVYPPPAALRGTQDRVAEKRLFEALGIPLPLWCAVDSRGDLEAAAARLGLPLILKTRRLGYDGKGQRRIERSEDIETAIAALGSGLVAEQCVDFDYEVSCIAARGRGGEIAIYPLSRNTHRGGILRRSIAPLDAPELQQAAGELVERLLCELDYVGVIALELFVVGDRLLANEYAPRVHNSGHWTIEAAVTSQFANHLLTISGRPPGATDCRGHAGMINLIGSIRDATRNAGVGTLHDYGKSPRPGRKLGHVTVMADSAAERDALVEIIDKTVT